MCLEVNGQKMKYMVTSREQHPGQNHKTKTGHKSLKIVENFKYLGATTTNYNFIHEKIKSRLKSGMLAIIRCRIFFLPGSIQKYNDQGTRNSNFACCFVWVSLVLSH
jgi:hypothetical protein